jgi:hypothetical protein
MQFSKNTSTSTGKGLLIKATLVLIITVFTIAMLSTMDFPSPNKKKEKIISNEKLKIVK